MLPLRQRVAALEGGGGQQAAEAGGEEGGGGGRGGDVATNEKYVQMTEMKPSPASVVEYAPVRPKADVEYPYPVVHELPLDRGKGNMYELEGRTVQEIGGNARGR